MNEKTIIYIAGYGRSGSTLLERILSSHEKIFGGGELSYFPDLITGKDSFCSCGKAVQKCEFWADVAKQFDNDFESITKLKIIQSRIESLSGLRGFIFGYKPDEEKAYKHFSQKLFGSIYQRLPDVNSYVVDSSKTAWKNFFRPIALSKIVSLNVKVIHLVRDGKGCMWSNLKGSNRRMEMGLDSHIPFAALRTAISWPLANIAAHLFQGTHSREDYCRIKYEDLVKDPAGTLAKLGEFLGVSFDREIEVLSSGGEIPIGHQIAGNRLRSQKRIVLKMDVEWRSNLKLHHKLLFWLLDWPLALWYGYR